jgi:hypothetical protein
MKPASQIVLLVVLVTITAGLSSSSLGMAGQQAEKSLEIERYPDEPLEFVDIKVSELSVKGNIVVTRRDGSEGLDAVKFKDASGWFKRVRVTLRNVSDRPIVGVTAYLYFKHPDSPMLFRVGLAGSTDLKRGILEPGAQIDLAVTDQRWNLTAGIMARHHVDAEQSSVTFSVESVRFSDDTQWSKGHLLRRDPANPNKWIPIDRVSIMNEKDLRPVNGSG